jgi:hypothetical protein
MRAHASDKEQRKRVENARAKLGNFQGVREGGKHSGGGRVLK